MIPDFQTIMTPFLRILADGEVRSLSEMVQLISDHYNLSENDRKMLVPSGVQTIINNRVSWVKSYFKKACLIESPQRGVLKISSRGLELLKEDVEINSKYLMKYEEFRAFKTKNTDINDTNNASESTGINLDITPEESIEIGYRQLRSELSQELLEKISSMSFSFFEKLVVEVLVKMGYGGSLQDAGRVIGKTGDEGIDGTIKEDKLGLDVIYIQAKRWQNVVGRPEIQKFVGALAGQGARKGVFITTSSFTADAKAYTPKNETKIVLIDGEQLAQMMIDYNVGVSLQNAYEIKRIDNDYFDEN